LQVTSTCFNRFAIDEIKSSSIFAFCFGGNFILGVGICYLDFAFRYDDLEEGGGIYAWKSLYILSATKLSSISGVGVINLCATFTNDLFYAIGLLAEGGLLPDLTDYLDPDLLPQLFSILNSPFEKMLIEYKKINSYKIQKS
jgi:hypothetical protein